MARARNIKPGFFANDQLGDLPPLARLLFIGLWGLADRKGKIEDRPKRIKAEVLPYDDCDVDEFLNLLAPEFIMRYNVDGISCIQILNFVKHQKPHPKEAESDLPDMLETSKATNRCELAGNKSGKDVPENLKTLTSNLKVSTSPAESLLLNVEPHLLNVDCCSPHNDGEANNSNTDEGDVILETSEPVDLTIDLEILPNKPLVMGTKAVNWAMKHWGRMISPGESVGIIAWCDEFSTRGSPDANAVVIEALKQCDNASVRNMKYLKAVLTDWREDGVLTMDHIEAREIEHKSQKGHKCNKDSGDKPIGLPKTPSSKYDKFYL